MSLLLGTMAVAASLVARPSGVAVRRGERLLVVAPHPDDETLGAGGLIQRVLARGGTVRVVLVTAGDGYVEAVVHETGRPRPRPAEYVAYGERRLREARFALRELGGDGIRAEHLLGFPDGGLEPLLRAHWTRTAPEHSPTTGATQSPYPEPEHADVRYDGADLRAALVSCLRDVRPTMIALPDPLDTHPDHHATGLFVLLAVDDWAGAKAKSRVATPRLLAYLVHWPGWPPGWNADIAPTDITYGTAELPAMLRARGFPTTALTLTDEEVAVKRRALEDYGTQQHEMAAFLATFVRRTEPFTLLTTAALRRSREDRHRSGDTRGRLRHHDRRRAARLTVSSRPAP